MANIGTWSAPFPLRFGGGSHQRIRRIFDTIRENVGDGLNSEMSATHVPANVAEDIAAARCLAMADRAIDRRLTQAGDPRKLTTMLYRWESILGITPSATDGDGLRRRRVAARLLGNYDATSSGLLSAMSEAFAPWRVALSFVPFGGEVAFWPGVGSPAQWFSTMAVVTVNYYYPPNASDADKLSRESAARESLDNHLPAWACFVLTPVLGP